MIFDRDRSRKSTSRGVGIGQDVVAFVRVGDAFVVVIVGVEVEERLNATGREPSELDEALIEVSAVTGLVGEGVLTAGSTATLIETLETVDLVTDIGSQRAVSRLSTRVDRDTATSEEARVVTETTRDKRTGSNLNCLGSDLRRGEERAGVVDEGVFRTNQPADVHAGVGAGDVEVACAGPVANPYVINRSRLPHGKIGGLGTNGGSKSGRRTEKKALTELHRQTSSMNDPTGLVLLVTRNTLWNAPFLKLRRTFSAPSSQCAVPRYSLFLHRFLDNQRKPRTIGCVGAFPLRQNNITGA